MLHTLRVILHGTAMTTIAAPGDDASIVQKGSKGHSCGLDLRIDGVNLNVASGFGTPLDQDLGFPKAQGHAVPHC